MHHRLCCLGLAGVLVAVPGAVGAPREEPMPNPPSSTVTDFADSAQVAAWGRHPVCGDPSFDAFERLPGNPVHRGSPPYEWPVNPFLFVDPVSGHWYLYVGLYLRGYDCGPGKPGSLCTGYRSTDDGRSWQPTGPVFPPERFCFEGDTAAVGHAPDVSVLYADGRYHMAYDWAGENTTWATAANPDRAAGQDGGVGYAWAERPEGPFVRTPRPLVRTSEMAPMLGRYKRAYAATLIRRRHDWLVLGLSDAPPSSWALYAMTSPKADGPYSPPALVRHVETDLAHPPLLEFFPAFVHAGFVYAPATSVASNRNFQCLFRAAIESAHQADAWELVQYGSLWHAEPVEHEAHGIWGQTFAGALTADGRLVAAFPCLDSRGVGTIGVAVRPWDRPLRDRGFVLTGHRGPSLTMLRRAYGAFALEATLEARGSVRLLWDGCGPLGPSAPSSDSVLHPLAPSRCLALQVEPERWELQRLDERGAAQALAQGPLPPRPTRELRMAETGDATARVAIDGAEVWRGATGAGVAPRSLGLWCGPGSGVRVQRFQVTGVSQPARQAYLALDGVLGAATPAGQWQGREGSEWRFGTGVLLSAGNRAKWNVVGRRFELWGPRGPGFGRGVLKLDGRVVAEIDCAAPQPQPAAPLATAVAETDGLHALVLEAVSGPVPIDTLDAE